MKDHLLHTNEGVEAVKGTAKAILETASLILSLVGVYFLGAGGAVGPEFSNVISVGMLLIMVGYFGVITISLYILMPKKLKGPIEPVWDTLYDQFENKSDVEVLRVRVSSYLKAIGINEKIVKNMSRWVVVAAALLGIIVLLLLGLGLWGLLAR
jgi:hypothetical protein